MRVWIDTDIGDDPDDAVALTVAVRHPAVELVGASTVFGDVETRARQARALLDALGRSDVPVHAGPPPDGALGGVDAVVAIGPLTNVARMRVSRRLVAMGGALGPTRHRGGVVEIEHNFASDPDAAARVVREEPDLVLVPLDVTARLTCTDDDVAALCAAAPPLRPHVDAWRAATRAPLCLHDPFALLVLLDDVPAPRRTIAIAVDQDGRVRVDGGGTLRAVVTDTEPRAVVDRVLRVTEGTRTPGLRDHNPTL